MTMITDLYEITPNAISFHEMFRHLIFRGGAKSFHNFYSLFVAPLRESRKKERHHHHHESKRQTICYPCTYSSYISPNWIKYTYALFLLHIKTEVASNIHILCEPMAKLCQQKHKQAYGTHLKHCLSYVLYPHTLLATF